jgi:hypothetical protein
VAEACLCNLLENQSLGYGLGIAPNSGMINTKIETTTTTELNLESEDRSRAAGRGHRLLTMVAISFVFLALCLMFVDFQRLDHLAPKNHTHNGHMLHQTRPARFVVR